MTKKKKGTYTLQILASPVGCPRKKEVLEEIQNAGGGPIPVKAVLGNVRNSRVDVCVDTNAPENVFGQVKAILDAKGNPVELDLTPVNPLMYDLILKGAIGNTITAEITVYEAPAVVVKHDGLLDEKVREAAKAAAARTGYTDMDERIEHMKANRVSGLLQLRVFNQMRRYAMPCRHPHTLYLDPYKEGKDESLYATCIRAACDRHHLIYQGDKSVGKNAAAESVAWELGMPYGIITLNPYMSMSDWNGDKKTDSSAQTALAAFDVDILAKAQVINEKRKPYYAFMAKLKAQGKLEDPAVKALMEAVFTAEDEAVLHQAAEFEKLSAQAASTQVVMEDSVFVDFVTHGGVLCLNELNLGNPAMTTSILNSVCDGTGAITLPGRGLVPVNKDLVLIGTQNPDYQGVQIQNEAMLSRFGAVIFEQPDNIKAQLKATVTAQLKKNGSDPDVLTDDYYVAAQAYYAVLMNAVKDQRGTADLTGACLNVRGFAKALVAVAQSEGQARLQKQLELFVVNACPTCEHAALKTLLRTTVAL